MILTIGLLIRLFFKNGSADFELTSCELTEDATKVRTTFSTSGITRWGARVHLSGVDYFWLRQYPPDSVKIVRHQSIWDQHADDFWRSLRSTSPN